MVLKSNFEKKKKHKILLEEYFPPLQFQICSYY